MFINTSAADNWRDPTIRITSMRAIADEHRNDDTPVFTILSMHRKSHRDENSSNCLNRITKNTVVFLMIELRSLIEEYIQ